MDVSEVEKWNINIITSNVNSQVYNQKQNKKVSPSSVTRSIHPFTASSIMPLESEMSPPVRWPPSTVICVSPESQEAAAVPPGN